MVLVGCGSSASNNTASSPTRESASTERADPTTTTRATSSTTPSPTATTDAPDYCTDDVSVYQFADAERAEYWANAVFPLHYRNVAIVLRFTEGGGHPTPEWAIPEYQAALDALAGQ